MVLDPIPQSLPVHFFGSRPQPPTSRLRCPITQKLGEKVFLIPARSVGPAVRLLYRVTSKCAAGLCLPRAQLQIFFRKRAINCRALPRKITYNEKAFCVSSPCCTWLLRISCSCKYTEYAYLAPKSARLAAMNKHMRTQGLCRCRGQT